MVSWSHPSQNFEWHYNRRAHSCDRPTDHGTSFIAVHLASAAMQLNNDNKSICVVL